MTVSQAHDLDARMRWLRTHRALAQLRGRVPRRCRRPSPSEVARVRPERCVALAHGCVDRLIELAWWQDGTPSWLTMFEPSRGLWRIRPVGSDLYEGLPGIALCFALFARITQDHMHRRFAELIAARLCEWAIAPLASESPPAGGFVGRGGWLYCLSIIRDAWNTSAYDAAIAHLVGSLADDVSSAETPGTPGTTHEILAGDAGCICSLLSSAHESRDGTAIDIARRRGERMLPGRAHRVGRAGRRLTGFAHGAAGEAYALSWLYAETGDARFAEAARRAVAYENGAADPITGSWPDFREHTDTPDGALSWCNGAGGIGLSRLWSGRLLGTREWSHDVRRARDLLRERAFGGSHGLCCGDLGRLELFGPGSIADSDSTRARDVGDADGGCQDAHYERLLAEIVHSMTVEGVICGLATVEPSETPGLMRGLAGIALGLLRHARPDAAPCIPMLRPWSDRLEPRRHDQPDLDGSVRAPRALGSVEHLSQSRAIRPVSDAPQSV